MVELVMRTKLKQAVPKEIRISASLAEALNQKVQEIINKAVERTKANKRTTVLPQDI